MSWLDSAISSTPMGQPDLLVVSKTTPTRPAHTRWLNGAMLIAVVGGLLLAVASLMAGHWYTLPKPKHEDPQLRAALWEMRSQDEQDEWVAYHILYSDCGCSRRVLEHLFSLSEDEVETSEKLILVGAHPEYERRAQAAQLSTLVLSPRELKTRLGIESAPLFIVGDPQGKLRYVGGYTERKRGLAILDREILSRARTEQPQSELPLFGCAVSKRLQDLVDPLGLKYPSP